MSTRENAWQALTDAADAFPVSCVERRPLTCMKRPAAGIQDAETESPKTKLVVGFATAKMAAVFAQHVQKKDSKKDGQGDAPTAQRKVLNTRLKLEEQMAEVLETKDTKPVKFESRHAPMSLSTCTVRCKLCSLQGLNRENGHLASNTQIS